MPSSGEHHRRQHRPDLLDHGQVDDAAEADFLPDGFELGVRFDGHHHADEGAGDADDRNGADADLVELGREQPQVLGRQAAGHQPPERLADEDEEVPEGFKRAEGAEADSLYKGNRHGPR